jgi:hypothetical protein
MDGRDILEDKLDLHPGPVVDRTLAAHAHIRALVPDASELHYTTQAVSVAFTLTGRLKEAFLHVAVYRGHVNLGFNQGASLDDPAGRLQGSGRAIRHVRLEDDTLDDPDIAALVAAAVAQGVALAGDRKRPNSVVRKS